MVKMKFFVGSDHAGFKAKESLKKLLEKKKIPVVDFGAFSDEIADYPDFAKKVGESVARENGSLGLLVCGTGIGMCIAANKIQGVRAANPFDTYTARAAREHNNANVICLGGRTYEISRAKKILEAFLKAAPSKEERHARRIGKISEMENEKC